MSCSKCGRRQWASQYDTDGALNENRKMPVRICKKLQAGKTRYIFYFSSFLLWILLLCSNYLIKISDTVNFRFWNLCSQQKCINHPGLHCLIIFILNENRNIIKATLLRKTCVSTNQLNNNNLLCTILGLFLYVFRCSVYHLAVV